MFKKLLALGLAVLMAMSLCSCALAEPILKSVLGEDVGGAVAGLLEDPAKKQYGYGKSAYDSLVRSEKICTEMSDMIYEAWYFAIYNADEYATDNGVINAFAEEIGVSTADLRTAYLNYVETDEYSAAVLAYALSEFRYALAIVGQVFKDKGMIAELDNELANAKEQIKVLGEEYPDYSELAMLKSYYAKLNSYAEFVKSPTGSFNQLGNTIETYEKEIRDCRKELELTFED